MSTEPVPIIANSPTQIQLTPDQQSAFFRAVNGALPSSNGGSNLASFLPGNAIAIPAFALGNALPQNISPDQFIVAVPVAQSSSVFSSQEPINPLAPPPAASIVPPAFRALCDSTFASLPAFGPGAASLESAEDSWYAGYIHKPGVDVSLLLTVSEICAGPHSNSISQASYALGCYLLSSVVIQSDKTISAEQAAPFIPPKQVTVDQVSE